MDLKLRRAGILVENMYQEMEVWVPYFRLQEAGAKVTLVGPKKETYRSKLGYPAEAELGADDATRHTFDALIIPGGYAPDLLRTNERLVEMVRSHVQRGAIVAAICHGTWMLASADVLRGRKPPEPRRSETTSGMRARPGSTMRPFATETSSRPASRETCRSSVRRSSKHSPKVRPSRHRSSGILAMEQ